MRTNKEDTKQYHITWYAKNKDKRKAQVNKRRIETSDWLREYKSALKCSKCEENAIECLEFHHTNPTEKEYMISSMGNRGYSIQRILDEVSKCIVLCSNCHKKLHASLIQREKQILTKSEC